MSRTLHSFCPHCETETECQVLSRPVTIEFRGAVYQAEEEFIRCSSCGQDFDVLGLRDPLEEVYEAHRQQRGFPTASQIAQLREKMGWDEQGFARMLNTSKTTVMLYERGALPSEEHGEVLKALCYAWGILSENLDSFNVPSTEWGDSAPPADSPLRFSARTVEISDLWPLTEATIQAA